MNSTLEQLKHEATRDATAGMRSHQRLAALAEQSELGSDTTDLEIEFGNILTIADALFQVTCEISKLVDGGKTAQQVRTDRGQDPLLRYFWKARTAVHHKSGFLKWSIGGMHINLHIVDSAAFRRATDGVQLGSYTRPEFMKAVAFMMGTLGPRRAFRRLREGKRPDPTLCEELGIAVPIIRSDLVLHEFSHMDTEKPPKVHFLEIPSEHLGKPIPSSAVLASMVVLEYYFSAIQAMFGKAYMKQAHTNWSQGFPAG